MRFLKGLFGQKTDSDKEVQDLPFVLLENEDQLDKLIRQSESHLVAIFKHSIRCGTSRMAFRAFKNGFDQNLENVEVYVLDILAHRELSDKIAARFQVLHESPQLLLIKKSQLMAHYSHHRISPAILRAYV